MEEARTAVDVLVRLVHVLVLKLPVALVDILIERRQVRVALIDVVDRVPLGQFGRWGWRVGLIGELRGASLSPT